MNKMRTCILVAFVGSSLSLLGCSYRLSGEEYVNLRRSGETARALGKRPLRAILSEEEKSEWIIGRFTRDGKLSHRFKVKKSEVEEARKNPVPDIRKLLEATERSRKEPTQPAHGD